MTALRIYRRDGTLVPGLDAPPDSQERLDAMLEVHGLMANHSYQVLSQDDIGPFFVSTVWLGLDVSHEGETGPPLIFETIVFQHGERSEQFCMRYATETEAFAGHGRIVAKIKEQLRPVRVVRRRRWGFF